MMFIIYF